VIVIITCAAAIVAMIQGSKEPTATAESRPTPTVIPSETAPADADVSSSAPAPSEPEASEGATATPAVPRIGIVAGHSGHDDGASCPDGLTEVEVNLRIAELVVQSLRGLGYQVDLLEEYDQRLTGYLADALVSIHADSCQRLPNATPPPTGFKVASVVDSVVPEEEERLVDCLNRAYAERTGLPIHENSITGHMTGYHTFYAIDGRTPGAIIETGFLWLDRDLLTEHPDIVAQGIVDGIVCFVERE
jgi:N-acetylmuramoyl-L-alanine amidase